MNRPTIILLMPLILLCVIALAVFDSIGAVIEVWIRAYQRTTMDLILAWHKPNG